MEYNRAFTLIELLSIIVLLGVITIVSVPSIATSSKKSKERDRQEFLQTVKNAAEVYVETHQDIDGIQKLKAGISTYCVNIDDLIATGLISSNLKNPDSNANVRGSVTASMSLNKINYDYSSAVCS